MARKHVAFLIVYGPEVRAFLYSGLAQKLSEKYDVTIITTHPNSQVYENVNYASIVEMPNTSENRWLARLRNYSRQSHKAWLRKKDLSTWRHFLVPENNRKSPLRKRLWRALIDNAAWFHVWPIFEKLAVQSVGEQEVWRDLFRRLDLNCLIVSSLKGETILPALQTAQNMKIKLVGIVHSWKDIYVSSYISVVPDRLIMPSKTATEYMLTVNPHILRELVSVSTSLHFEKILNPDKILPRREFCDSVGLDWQRPYICYTAASPLAVLGELDILEVLLSEVAKLPDLPQVLLRVNPMDNGHQFITLQNLFQNVLVLQKPNWEWRSNEGWCSPFESDMALWINTIYHSVCNVSVPSTVTLEFASVNKPVINICFDIDQNLAQANSVSRFWDAPFYDEIKQSGYAVPTFSVEDLFAAIRHIMDDSPKVSERILFPSEHPVEDVLEQIQSVLDHA